MNQKTEEFYSFAKKGKKKRRSRFRVQRKFSEIYRIWGEILLLFEEGLFFTDLYLSSKGLHKFKRKESNGQGIGTFLQFWSTISRALSESSI